MELKPLVRGADVRIHSGRYKVQLEIPEWSTLSENDIGNIAAVSSWEVDPGEASIGYEGIRSVLLEREKQIEKKGIGLDSLQVSGIGYREPSGRIESSFERGLEFGHFSPPSPDNFMDIVGDTMWIGHFERGKLIKEKPEYKPMGTYTLPGLINKIEKTTKVSSLNLDRMAVPHVEAYGRYVEDELSNQEGNFGFIVFPVPNKHRLANEAFNIFLNHIRDKNMTGIEQALSYYFIMSSKISPFIESLRELHDRGFAHMQTHLSNLYIVEGKPYVMDWSTMVKLKRNSESAIMSRALDITRPVKDYTSIMSETFELDEFTESWEYYTTLELIMEIYSGKFSHEIHIEDLYKRTKKILEREPNEFEIVVQWMKDNEIRVKKVKPNEPCPCDSGKKFKKCCGGH